MTNLNTSWDLMDKEVQILITICDNNGETGYIVKTNNRDHELAIPTKSSWDSAQLPPHEGLQFKELFFSLDSYPARIYHTHVQKQLSETFLRALKNNNKIVFMRYDGLHFDLDFHSKSVIQSIHDMYFSRMGKLLYRHLTHDPDDPESMPPAQNAGVFLYECTESGVRVGLIQERNNVWNIPSGRIDVGESPQEGAIRELKEETSHIIELDPKGTYHTIQVGDFHLLLVPASPDEWIRSSKKFSELRSKKQLNQKETIDLMWFLLPELESMKKCDKLRACFVKLIDHAAFKYALKELHLV